MKNCKNAIVIVWVAAILFGAVAAQTNQVALLRYKLNLAREEIPADVLNVAVLGEPLNFTEFSSKYPLYGDFAAAVSNDLPLALGNFNAIATNEVERLLLIGVSGQYDENFYIAFMGFLSDMKTSGLVTAAELRWAASPARSDLITCLARRYKEPVVIGLIDKYKVSRPDLADYWNEILSGEAYTNYLEEVEAGLWQ